MMWEGEREKEKQKKIQQQKLTENTTMPRSLRNERKNTTK